MDKIKDLVLANVLQPFSDKADYVKFCKALINGPIHTYLNAPNEGTRATIDACLLYKRAQYTKAHDAQGVAFVNALETQVKQWLDGPREALRELDAHIRGRFPTHQSDWKQTLRPLCVALFEHVGTRAQAIEYVSKIRRRLIHYRELEPHVLAWIHQVLMDHASGTPRENFAYAEDIMRDTELRYQVQLFLRRLDVDMAQRALRFPDHTQWFDLWKSTLRPECVQFVGALSKGKFVDVRANVFGTLNKWKAPESFRVVLAPWFETVLEEFPRGVSTPRGEPKAVHDTKAQGVPPFIDNSTHLIGPMRPRAPYEEGARRAWQARVFETPPLGSTPFL